MGTEAPEPDALIAEHVEQPPKEMLKGGSGADQKVELFTREGMWDPKSIGWLGQDGSQWCVVTSADGAVAVRPYVEEDILYYQNASDAMRFLSVSVDGAVGFYNWRGATGWTLNDDRGIDDRGPVMQRLTSLYANAQLSIQNSELNKWSHWVPACDGYVYASRAHNYTPLVVKFHDER